MAPALAINAIIQNECGSGHTASMFMRARPPTLPNVQWRKARLVSVVLCAKSLAYQSDSRVSDNKQRCAPKQDPPPPVVSRGRH